MDTTKDTDKRKTKFKLRFTVYGYAIKLDDVLSIGADEELVIDWIDNTATVEKVDDKRDT